MWIKGDIAERARIEWNRESIYNPKKRYLSMILALFLVIFVGGGWYVYSNYLTPQAEAKNIVEKYLKATMNADSTYEYRYSSVDDFINVLDYKFVRYGEKTKKHIVEEVSEDEYFNNKDELYSDLTFNNMI